MESDLTSNIATLISGVYSGLDAFSFYSFTCDSSDAGTTRNEFDCGTTHNISGNSALSGANPDVFNYCSQWCLSVTGYADLADAAAAAAYSPAVSEYSALIDAFDKDTGSIATYLNAVTGSDNSSTISNAVAAEAGRAWADDDYVVDSVTTTKKDKFFASMDDVLDAAEGALGQTSAMETPLTSLFGDLSDNANTGLDGAFGALFDAVDSTDTFVPILEPVLDGTLSVTLSIFFDYFDEITTVPECFLVGNTIADVLWAGCNGLMGYVYRFTTFFGVLAYVYFLAMFVGWSGRNRFSKKGVKGYYKAKKDLKAAKKAGRQHGAYPAMPQMAAYPGGAMMVAVPMQPFRVQ
eukprot:gnl/Ergobibamus_cyprinoides/553.p1 GENE.gnl/Ergobibamus_cyprinoides/553~~gnl/Ergobibamus_cyprinoides/553.p1  ORF type:complete len:350 (-),score=155.29 gnl/Ergobibamus_cyprinoides/553:105-1154(-)